MQVYRELDIGTAKPSGVERREVRHHVVDVADPDEDYTVSRFQSDVASAGTAIADRGGVGVLVGGTGLYVRAVVDELVIPGQYPGARAEIEAEPDTVALHARLQTLDPAAAERMDQTNRRRIVRALEVTVGSGRRFSSYGPGLESYRSTPIRLVGLRMPRPVMDRRIEARYAAQIDAGFVDEVAVLATRRPPLSRTARQALGYKELLDHVEGRASLDEALDVAMRRTRRFARRQERWFRRDPRIHWIDVDDDPLSALGAVLAHFDQCT